MAAKKKTATTPERLFVATGAIDEGYAISPDELADSLSDWDEGELYEVQILRTVKVGRRYVMEEV